MINEEQLDPTQSAQAQTPEILEEMASDSMSETTHSNIDTGEGDDRIPVIPDAIATELPKIDPPPSGEDSTQLASAIAAKDAEIEALKAKFQEVTEQSKRIAADFDNYRKRTQKEKDDLSDQIKCSTLRELLPVVDNFERARSQIKPSTDSEMNIHKSYQSVYKQLVDCLKRVGVSPMRSEGKDFDPMFHEAVMRQPTTEQAEGTVMEELVRGYMLNERVLRHAMVKVAAAPEPEMEVTEAPFSEETSES